MEITEDTRQLLEKDYKHGNHLVKWSLFDSKSTINITKNWTEDEAKAKAYKNSSGVCYSSLRSQLCERPTYLFTSIPMDDYPKSVLSVKELLSWVRLLKKNKLLPYYVKPVDIVGDGSELKVMFNLKTMKNKQQLYTYLALLRHLKEDPGFPKVVLHLVHNLKLDFFTALSVGSYYGIRYAGHSIIPFIAPYPRPREVGTALFNLQYSKALKLFSSDPGKYGMGSLSDGGIWGMSNVLQTICTKAYTVSFKDLDKEETTNFINSKKRLIMSKNDDHHTSKMNHRRDNAEVKLRNPVSKKSIRSKDKQVLKNIINSGKFMHLQDEEDLEDDFDDSFYEDATLLTECKA